MSTLKTTNLQESNSSSANIVLGTGGGGGATISGVTTVTALKASGDITANGNIIGDGSTNITNINDATVSSLSVSSDLIHTGDTDTKVRFTTDTISAETGGTERIRVTSAGNLKLPDSAQIELGGAQGGSGDLKIYHASNESKIVNSTGSLWLQSDTGIRFTDAGLNQSMAAFYDNAQCELFHNGIKKLATSNTYGTVLSNTTDNAAYTNTLLLTRRGYEASGYGVVLQAKGGSSAGQNGLNIQVSNASSYVNKVSIDGDGIKFNGDTAAANGLDDYEEGTANATFVGNEGGSSSLSNAVTYTKIGDWVHICFAKNNFSNNGIGGTLEIGMPFTSSNADASAEWFGPDVYWYPSSVWDTYTDHCGFNPVISANSSSVKFVVKRKDQDRQMRLSASNNNQISTATGMYCRFTISYRCA